MKFDSLLAKMDRLPPCLCRLLARKRVKGGQFLTAPKSHSDIAKEMGIHRDSVSWYSRKKTWAGIPIGTADRFARACGVNLAEIDVAISELKEHQKRLRHLKNGNGNQRRMITSLLAQTKPGTRQSDSEP